MYARLLVRSVASLALYSGIYLQIAGGAYNRTVEKKRFKTINIAVLIKTLFEFTGFDYFKTSYKIEFIPRGNHISGRAYTWMLNKRSKADFTVGNIYIFLPIFRKARPRL